MIKAIDGSPDNVIGFKAEGKVFTSDYESILMPAVDAATQGDGKARFLFVFGADFRRLRGWSRNG